MVPAIKVNYIAYEMTDLELSKIVLVSLMMSGHALFFYESKAIVSSNLVHSILFYVFMFN